MKILLFLLIGASVIAQQTITIKQIRDLPPTGVGPTGSQGPQGIPGPVGPQGLPGLSSVIQVTSFRGVLLHGIDTNWTMVNTFAVPRNINPEGQFSVFYNGIYQNTSAYTVGYTQETNTWDFTFKTPFTIGDNAEARYIATTNQ